VAESKLSPLQFNVAITNEDGTPTPYFIQLLQQLYEEKALSDAAIGHSVLAGAGLTGGGVIEDGNITLSADVQAILNLVSTTRGAILYRGAAAWSALLPGAAGNFLKTNGAGADPSWAAAAAGSTTYEIAGTSPALANFTYMSPVSAAYILAAKTYGLEVYHTSAAGALFSMARFNTAPNLATGQTITARMASTDINLATGYDMALMLRNSTNGRFVAFMNYNYGGNFLVQNWTSTANMATSAFSGNLTNSNYYGNSRTFPWRRVVIAAGGTFTFQASADGDIWHDVVGSIGITLASFLTAAGGGTLDQVGFGTFSARCGTLLQSWTMV
jgi:hypothetical protein